MEWCWGVAVTLRCAEVHEAYLMMNSGAGGLRTIVDVEIVEFLAGLEQQLLAAECRCFELEA